MLREVRRILAAVLAAATLAQAVPAAVAGDPSAVVTAYADQISDEESQAAPLKSVSLEKSAEADTGSAITVSTGTSIRVHKATLQAKPVKAAVKLTISHKKESGAHISGYAIYKQNKDGVWVRRTTIKSRSKTTYLDTNTTSTRDNVYRVRAYFIKDGTTYYGDYTDPVRVSVEVSPVRKKVTDKSSPVYGKTLVIYRYADGSAVEDMTRYVDEDSFSTYTIYVNKAKQYVTAYGVKGDELYPLRVFICSPGAATPVGSLKISVKFRWHELIGPCWGQWCSRVAPGIYFHSIFSSRINDNKTMSVSAYNKLGTTCSHGCIRLQAASAKWIYDHCRTGTSVIVTQKRGYEPFKKPVVGKLPSWHTWDPTDPTAQKYCKEHKCHEYAK